MWCVVSFGSGHLAKLSWYRRLLYEWSDPVQVATYVRVYLDLSFVHVVSVADIKQALS